MEDVVLGVDEGYGGFEEVDVGFFTVAGCFCVHFVTFATECSADAGADFLACCGVGCCG